MPLTLGVRLWANKHLALRPAYFNMSTVTLFFICTVLAIALALWPVRRSILAVGVVFLATYYWLLSEFQTEINQPDNDSPGVIGAMLLMLVPALLVAILGGLRIIFALLSHARSLKKKASQEE